MPGAATPRAIKAIAFAATLLVFLATWIHPIWPLEQAMHASLAVVGLAWLWWHAGRWQTSDGAFIAICLFIAIHSIAARWLYSNVPYDAWFRAAIGWSPQAAFGWSRNHADRFIHLLFGLCFAPAMVQYVSARWRPSAAATGTIVVMAIMCTSLLYEWLEWGVALSLAPGQAEAYNGQQGDVWDAHMDMLLATLGGLFATVASCRRLRPEGARGT